MASELAVLARSLVGDGARAYFLVDRLRELHGANLTAQHVRAACARLQAGCSLASASGLAYFRTGAFECGGVLVPRADSSVLVDAALAVLRGRAAPWSVLDCGTGSGALLLATALEASEPLRVALGLDLSPTAVHVARRNALRNRVPYAAFEVRDWRTAASQLFDCVLWNPPYVESALLRGLEDPVEALDGGDDGMRWYREPPVHWLRPGGALVTEVGRGQLARVVQLIALPVVDVRCDDAGVERCVVFARQ